MIHKLARRKEGRHHCLGEPLVEGVGIRMGVRSWLPLGPRTFVYRGWVSVHTPPGVCIFSSIPCSLYELRWATHLLPCRFSALKGVSLAPSSRTQCWAGGKVGKHRKDALGVKTGPEDRAEPRKAQPEAHGSPKVGSFRGCFWCWTLYWIFFVFSRFGGFGLLFFLSSQPFFCWAVHPFEADADQEAFSRCLCHFIVTEASTHLLSFFIFQKCFHCEWLWGKRAYHSPEKSETTALRIV